MLEGWTAFLSAYQITVTVCLSMQCTTVSCISLLDNMSEHHSLSPARDFCGWLFSELLRRIKSGAQRQGTGASPLARAQRRSSRRDTKRTGNLCGIYVVTLAASSQTTQPRFISISFSSHHPPKNPIICLACLQLQQQAHASTHLLRFPLFTFATVPRIPL